MPPEMLCPMPYRQRNGYGTEYIDYEKNYPERVDEILSDQRNLLYYAMRLLPDFKTCRGGGDIGFYSRIYMMDHEVTKPPINTIEFIFNSLRHETVHYVLYDRTKQITTKSLKMCEVHKLARELTESIDSIHMPDRHKPVPQEIEARALACSPYILRYSL